MNDASLPDLSFSRCLLAPFRRFVWLALVLCVGATAHAGVYLSSYTFSSANVPYVYTNESLPIPFKLRVKIIGVPGYPNGFHAVQAYNNNYYSLESLPTPGTYTVALYWLKYASDWTTLLEVGPQATTTITVQSPPAVNGVAWNSINLPTDGTGIGLPGQTITATATVTNNGSTYWDDAYYLELKDANENHLNYPQINGVSPGSSKTSTFVLTLPTTAGVYTYGFTAMQNGVQYFGGTQYRTITVNRNPVAGSFSASASTISSGQTATLSCLVTDPDSNLTSQVIDYLAPGSATWISGTVASGTRWDGAATSANTLSKTMVLSTAGTWQFRVRGGDALGGTSAFLYQNITVQSSSAVNGVAWNSINLPTDGTGIGLPGQTITATATVTNNGSTYWDDAYYLELKDANENHLNYPQINGVSPGSSKTATFGLTLPSTAGVYTSGFTAVQQNVQYFGGTQYRTITVNRNPVAGTLTASASTIFPGQTVTLSGLVTDPDSNLTSQAIDYLAPGSATWIGGTVAAGTRWDGAATSANTLTKTMVLSTVGTWQFRLSGGDALGGTSPFLYQNVTLAPAPPPIRLALQYWQQNDYPDREYGHDETYWVDGYWDSQWTYDWSNPEWWNTGHYEDVWVDGHDETNFVVDGTYADGEFGSRWDTTTGTYGQPATSATGAFNPAATNRGYVLNSYELSTRTTFRAWASAPAANCNTYQAVLYSPTGSILASGSFASNSYWQFDFYPYPAGAYRVDLSFQNASATTPANGTVSYYIPVGISLPPTITTQPSPTNQTVASGATVTYSIVASLATTYQWRKDGASISGATSSTLTLTNVQPSNSGSYTVVVGNTGGSQTSAAANLTVSVTAPAISSQPVSQTTNVGQPVSFAVAATGTAPLAYQWLKNGVSLAGATNASLTLANPQTTDAANAPGYTVMVSNLAGTATSSAAALTVNLVAPSITTQPISRSVYTGATVTFSVVAGGTAPLTYQWRKNGVNVGTNSSNYTISSALTSDAGAYSVVVSNGAGAVTSNSANLTVTVVDPIRLAVKYWRANDYPNRTWYTYEEVWVGDWRTVDEYDENGDWSGSHDEWIDWEWQWVYHYAPTGEFAPRWDTTAGDFDLASTASGYSAATANRGYFKNSYNPGDLITFHPYATAPSANCSNYTWALFSPSGSPIAGYWFSGITAWSFSANYGAGNYRVDVSYQSATSGTPLNATVSYYIPVGVAPPAVPAVTSPLAASGTVGTAFAYTITATNSPTIYGATGLPAGLTLNTATGAITGTPTAAGTFSVSLTASNAGGTSLAATMVLSVGSGVPVITSPLASSGTVGTAFAYTITATNSPTSFGATSLPAGLSLNTATGAITGTPTAAGAYSVSLTASNSGGTSPGASVLLSVGSVLVAPAPVALPAEQITDSRFLASWLPVSGATGYRLDVSTNAGFSNLVLSNYAPVYIFNGVSSIATSHTVSGLSANTDYWYRVRVVTAAGTSENSASISVRTAAPVAGAASVWFDKPVDVQVNCVWTKVYDGVADEIIPAGGLHGLNYYVLDWRSTATTITFNENDYDVNDWWYPRTAYFDVNDDGSADFWRPAFTPFWQSGFTFTYPGEIYLRLGVEFDPEPGYAYEICYSTNDVLSPASLSVVNGGGNIYVENATRMIFALFNEFTPQQLDRGSLYLVRYSLAPGGCVLNLPGIGAVTASKTNGTVTLANGTKITAGPVGATITFPGGSSITIGTDGTVGGAALPSGVTHIPGVPSIALPDGITVNPGTGEVTVAGPAGSSVTVGGAGGLRVALPPGLASIAGIIGKAVDTVGNILGIGTDPNKTKVDNGDGIWRDLDDPALSTTLGTQTVRVGVTDNDSRGPKQANIFSISFTVPSVMIKKVASGDITAVTWGNAAVEPLTQPIYAGDNNGDMVGWSLNDLLPGTYSWSATGPFFDNAITFPLTIQGPSGENVKEWRIARGDGDVNHDWIDWKPGTYRIKCQVQRPWGQISNLEYNQRVGWRSRRYLVAGQVRPVQDYSLTASQKTDLQAALLLGVDFGPNWNAAFFSALPLDELITAWMVARGPNGLLGFPQVTSFPASITEAMKFYMLQQELNNNPDEVDLRNLSVMDTAKIIELASNQSYRMYSEYQVKYVLSEYRRLQTVETVGSPTAWSGPTKITIWSGLAGLINGAWLASNLPSLNLPTNGSQILIPSLENRFNNVQRVDRINGKVSLYTSARIGREASGPNYALFERDVPYIFNEIVFGLDEFGRDRANQVRLSMNIVWNQTVAGSGLNYFNEISLYEKVGGSTAYSLLQQYRLDGGAQMIRPFILSVPTGQFPTIEPQPLVLEAP